MASSERPWEDMHHRSYFIPQSGKVGIGVWDSLQTRCFNWCQNPIPSQDVYAKGNMANISRTMPIDTSVKPAVIENILIGADCSP